MVFVMTQGSTIACNGAMAIGDDCVNLLRLYEYCACKIVMVDAYYDVAFLYLIFIYMENSFIEL